MRQANMQSEPTAASSIGSPREQGTRPGRVAQRVPAGSRPVEPLQFHRVRPTSAARSAATVRSARRRVVRRPAGRSQLLRQSVQAAFVLLNLWIGARFYLFVRYYETGGRTLFAARPPGVEGWLPIAALMNLKYALLTRTMPDVHPAGLFLLVAFIGISFTFKKAFCGWLCPIGTISEWLWRGGREILGRTFALPRWLDVPLRSLKYLLLGLFLYAVGRMSAGDLAAFMHTPYGVLADVKMLNFFRALSTTGATVIVVLVVSSLLVKNAWCRYLCPYGALMGLVALASPARIRRDPASCIDCGKCAKACPSMLPVDIKTAIVSPECTGCLECVASCPVRGALDFSLPRRRVVPAWLVAAGIAVVFLAAVGYARWSGHWQTNVPERTLFELVPNASSFGHPGY